MNQPNEMKTNSIVLLGILASLSFHETVSAQNREAPKATIIGSTNEVTSYLRDRGLPFFKKYVVNRKDSWIKTATYCQTATTIYIPPGANGIRRRVWVWEYEKRPGEKDYTLTNLYSILSYGLTNGQSAGSEVTTVHQGFYVTQTSGGLSAVGQMLATTDQTKTDWRANVVIKVDASYCDDHWRLLFNYSPQDKANNQTKVPLNVNGGEVLIYRPTIKEIAAAEIARAGIGVSNYMVYRGWETAARNP